MIDSCAGFLSGDRQLVLETFTLTDGQSYSQTAAEGEWERELRLDGPQNLNTVGKSRIQAKGPNLRPEVNYDDTQ